MGIKARSGEPTADEVIQRCPVSATSPATGKPFDLQLIRDVFSTECYDLVLANPWRFQHKTMKTFLPQSVMEHRVAMCKALVAMCCFTASWFFSNVVWIDPCSSIIPGSYKQYLRMRQAFKGDKGWLSDGAKHSNNNRRGPKTALSQTTWDGMNVNWVVALAKGVINVDILPLDWDLDGECIATVVRRLGARMQEMLGAHARLPRVLMTDRGTGMYAPSGHVVAAYDRAVADCHFRLLWGPDAKQQSPEMPGLLLHEAAVSWIRNALRRSKPEVVPWMETPEQWSRRMMKAVGAANQKDVEGLCRSFPGRVDECILADGARLSY